LSERQVAGECIDESPSRKYWVQHEIVQEILSDSFIVGICVELLLRTHKLERAIVPLKYSHELTPSSHGDHGLPVAAPEESLLRMRYTTVRQLVLDATLSPEKDDDPHNPDRPRSADVSDDDQQLGDVGDVPVSPANVAHEPINSEPRRQRRAFSQRYS
jgi:hypothetical protein